MPRDPKGMICSLCLQYVVDIYIQIMCLLSQHFTCIYQNQCGNIQCIYALLIHQPFILSDLCCHSWKASVICVCFPMNWIKNAIVCVCVWIFLFLFMCVLIITPSLESVTWFIAWPSFHSWSSFLSLFSFWMLCSSIFLFHWIFQDAELPTWNPEPRAQLNKELNSKVLL